MSKWEKIAIITAAIVVGMQLVILFNLGLRYFEWAMLAIGGNFR